MARRPLRDLASALAAERVVSKAEWARSQHLGPVAGWQVLVAGGGGEERYELPSARAAVRFAGTLVKNAEELGGRPRMRISGSRVEVRIEGDELEISDLEAATRLGAPRP